MKRTLGVAFLISAICGALGSFFWAPSADPISMAFLLAVFLVVVTPMDLGILWKVKSKYAPVLAVIVNVIVMAAIVVLLMGWKGIGRGS
jgi:hypothetical protein